MLNKLQLLSEALWEAVKTDLIFFSAIQSFVKKLAEFNYINIEKEDTKEILFCAKKIEDFFKSYRPPKFGLGIIEPQAAMNDDTAKSILQLSNELAQMDEEQLEKEIALLKPKIYTSSSGKGYIFIGHGRSKLWARVQIYLENELKLKTLTYESESHTSESIINILKDFLSKASFAILILTAEDETKDGKIRARQNVIHESGLFQGRLGFENVVLLKQTKTEDFSNIAGLQYITFANDNIEQTFYELQRTLQKNGLIK